MSRKIIENAKFNTRLMLKEATGLKAIQLSDINELRKVYSSLKQDIQLLLDTNEKLLKGYIKNNNSFAFVYDEKKKINFIVLD